MKKSVVLFSFGIILWVVLVSSCSNEKFASQNFTDSVFTAGIEGPCYHTDGNIYVVNYLREGTIGKVSPDGNCELFLELPKGSTGNGIRFDKGGNMCIADYSGHSILKVDMKTKAISVFAHDTLMNQPNDLVVAKNDLIFCSDPNWKNSTGNLWRINLDGTTTLLMDSLGTTNGIELSPDNQSLYVNESVQRNIWKFKVNEKGEILAKELFYSFEDGGMDGMKCDSKGNLYVARYDKGSIVVLSQVGKLVKEISLLGKKPTNLTIGGKDEKTIFVTLQDRGRLEYITTE